jgi:hypothetical protein
MMTKSKTQKEICFVTLYAKFISDSRRGKRLQPNGKKLSEGTVKNYEHTLAIIKLYVVEKIGLRIRPVRKLNTRELEMEKPYWKKFYRKFSVFLYQDQGYYDNDYCFF